MKERLLPDKTTYIFLDEIQKVAFFEKAVDSLYVKPNVDIYITGSNAYMLSGDLATLLSGSYVEIGMLTLSFKEFLEITGLPKEQGFAQYLQSRGLPYVAAMDRTDEKALNENERHGFLWGLKKVANEPKQDWKFIFPARQTPRIHTVWQIWVKAFHYQ